MKGTDFLLLILLIYAMASLLKGLFGDPPKNY